MNAVRIDDVAPEIRLVSFQDTAMYLNLMYHEIIEELLEVFIDFTDFDIIAEVVDTLKLNITAVIEPINNGMLIHGYIHKGGA